MTPKGDRTGYQILKRKSDDDDPEMMMMIDFMTMMMIVSVFPKWYLVQRPNGVISKRPHHLRLFYDKFILLLLPLLAFIAQ
ncbi:MAG: hypothetical protein HYR87_07445 [Thaumarchaeota archaeon]|nr:hypothetical protein [Nitrososphaerota archaeon]